jgi:hypothetical protein
MMGDTTLIGIVLDGVITAFVAILIAAFVFLIIAAVVLIVAEYRSDSPDADPDARNHAPRSTRPEPKLTVPVNALLPPRPLRMGVDDGR